MSSSTSSFNFKNPVPKFLCWLVLFTLAGGALNFYLQKQENDTAKPEWDKRRFWPEKVARKPKYQILFIGDSRIHMNVDAALMEKTFEIPVYDMAFSAGGINDTILRYANDFKLAPSGRPRVVILGVTPLTLAEISRKNDNFRNLCDMHQPGEFTPGKVAFADAFFRAKLASRLRNHVRVKKETVSKQKSPEDSFVYDADHGTIMTPDPPDGDRIQITLNHYQWLLMQSKLSEESVSEMISWIRKWMQQGVLVVAFRPTFHQKMRTNENAALTWYDEKVIAERIRTAGGLWLDIPETYTSFDASHLEYRSGQEFTRFLIEAIRKHI